MAEAVVDLGKKKRSVLRTAVTKLTTKLETEINKMDADADEIEVLLEQLQDKFVTLNTNSAELEKMLKPEEAEKELVSSEEYREKVILWQFKAKKKLRNLQHTSESVNMSSGSVPLQIPNQNRTESIQLKLPLINLKSFSGDNITDFLSFWNSYETTIHNNEQLDSITKFNYLKTYLTGNALQTIEGFAITELNYLQAIQLLKNKYLKKEVQINAHIRNLLNISCLKRTTDIKNFRRLFDTVQINIRSLEAIGEKIEHLGTTLCPIILNCLPYDLVYEFNKQNEDTFHLETLLKFLEHELTAREKSQAFSSHPFAENRDTFQNDHKSFSFHNKKAMNCFSPPARQSMHNESRRTTAVDLLVGEKGSGNNTTCVFCGKDSDVCLDSATCKFARNLSYEEKKKILIKKGHCLRCVKAKHFARDCRGKVFCGKCKKSNHMEIMCFRKTEGEERNKEPQIDECTSLNNADVCASKEVSLQTFIVCIKGNKREYLIRAIYDTGSMRSHLSTFVAKKLGLFPTGREKIIHSLFGGLGKTEEHKKYRITLTNINKEFTCDLEVLDQNRICLPISKINDPNTVSELKELGIFLSDVEIGEKSCLFERDPNEVHLLVGADFAGKLMTGEIQTLSNGLTAVKSRLGWTVMGKIESCENSLVNVSLLNMNDVKISDMWNLENLGIFDRSEQVAKRELEELAVEHFKQTVERNAEGRYKVCLPWEEGRPALGDNKALAEKRLKGTVKSLVTKDRLPEYEKVFMDWEKEGIIEKISPGSEKCSSAHYLAHRPVFKENSTSPIRPVFDASCKGQNSLSINECLEKGPNLILLIPSILNRFRLKEIGVIADIRKAFLQIELHEKDRDYLRFLWWTEGNPEKKVIYRHNRVIFGICSSPWLLGQTLSNHLDLAPEHLQTFAKELKESFYVDNLVTSVDSPEELNHLRTESQKLLAAAKFDLRGWRNNTYDSQAVSEEKEYDSSEVPVLGLMWNLEEDTLYCDTRNLKNDDRKMTKRSILSTAHRIFDPVGFSSPVSLGLKLLMQECWKAKTTWDGELPEHIIQEYVKCKKQIENLEDLKIPRRLTRLSLRDGQLSLHVFCDASKASYACCIYLRVEEHDEVTCTLVQARSKVAPLKTVTIPRLELLACCMGARLATTVKEDLRFEEVETIYWSDSMDALHWIKRKGPWAVFVGNRVEEIRKLTDADSWKFVPGNLNPSDIPSRGCSVKTLIAKKWIEGPSWLKGKRDTWPEVEIIPNEQVVNKEKRKIIVSSINQEKDAYYLRISSYKKIVSITAWIYRFWGNCKKKKDERKFGEIDGEEYKKAERMILRKIQDEVFTDEENERLRSLPTFRDAEGIIRTKARAFLRNDEDDFRFPIILPGEHPVVKGLILWSHKTSGHAGTQFLMSSLREKFWILQSRRSIKKVIKTCFLCQKFKASPPKIPEGPLPEERVKDASVFEIIGVDVAGPLYLKNGQKTWILLITCAIYRAVHLELMTSLSSENFLLAFRRFIARRGRPLVIFSDQGTNFVGSDNLMRCIDVETLKPQISPMTWKFIPAYSPWWGGFWERLVGLMKRILRKTLGRTSLSYEELATVLCECESLLNARPLTYVSDDISDLEPLTPAMFIQENKESGVVDLDKVDQLDRGKLTKRLLYRQRVLKDLRTRFRSEYLGQLRQNYKKGGKLVTPKIGDLVIVSNDRSNRITWPMARILDMYPSKDGLVRLAKIMTTSGTLIRPLKRLCLLELDDSQELDGPPELDDPLELDDLLELDDPPDASTPDAPTLQCPDSNPTTSRARRTVRAPERYGYAFDCVSGPNPQKPKGGVLSNLSTSSSPDFNRQ